jgi:SAM-dependent methyltransferase
MLRDRIRAWFTEPVAETSSNRTSVVLSSIDSDRALTNTFPFDHASKGLQQLLQSLPDRDGLSILDLGDINQANVAFMTGLGHRHCNEDVLAAFDAIWPDYDPALWQSRGTTEFLDGLLRFPPHHFDAVLVWDTFQFLPQPLAEQVLERLLQVVRPDGPLLAMFHADVRRPVLAAHSYRILDPRMLRIVPKGMRPVGQTFNNRSLEQLFQTCRSMKFFLTRDSLREVIVRR